MYAGATHGSQSPSSEAQRHVEGRAKFPSPYGPYKCTCTCGGLLFKIEFKFKIEFEFKIEFKFSNSIEIGIACRER